MCRSCFTRLQNKLTNSIQCTPETSIMCTSTRQYFPHLRIWTLRKSGMWERPKLSLFTTSCWTLFTSSYNIKMNTRNRLTCSMIFHPFRAEYELPKIFKVPTCVVRFPCSADLYRIYPGSLAIKISECRFRQAFSNLGQLEYRCGVVWLPAASSDSRRQFYDHWRLRGYRIGPGTLYYRTHSM